MWSGLKPSRAYREYPNYARACQKAYVHTSEGQGESPESERKEELIQGPSGYSLSSQLPPMLMSGTQYHR